MVYVHVFGKIFAPFLGCTVSPCKGVSQHQRTAPRQAVCHGESGQAQSWHHRPSLTTKLVGILKLTWLNRMDVPTVGILDVFILVILIAIWDHCGGKPAR